MATSWRALPARRARLVLFVLLLCVITYVSSTSASFLRARRVSSARATEGLVWLINEQRRMNNKPSVCTNMKLMRASQVMTNDMADSDYFHGTGDDTSSPAERVSAQRFVFTTLTEDVAAGFQNAREALEALLQVQEHRDNILGDYQFVGAGYSYGSSTGYKHFWALHFANAVNEDCDAPVEKEASESESWLRRWLGL